MLRLQMKMFIGLAIVIVIGIDSVRASVVYAVAVVGVIDVIGTVLLW